MTIGKLCLAAFLAAIPALAVAQPSVSVGVDVNLGPDAYATAAPGDPVESVDVFYDQLSPYGVWLDEPDVGRVFVPDMADYVPYTTGHWQYTNLGFVWISTEPFAWATSHYGRWAYSRYYQRWYWLPDTAWGPAWVQWRSAGAEFGWAPLAPDVVVRAGWEPPFAAWHYCSAEHLLDVNVTRYYAPRDRVIVIHRQARPIEHYATVSNVRVVVGPPPSVLREHHVAVRPVRVEPRTVGRWTQTEARAQVERAREHRATFEVQNQQRIERNTRIRAAHVQVLEAHPQIKAQVTARVRGAAQPEPSRENEPGRERTVPGQRPSAAPSVPERSPERGRPAEPAHVAPPAQRTPDPRGRDQHQPEPPTREHAAPTPPAERPPAQKPAEPSDRDRRQSEPSGRDQRPAEPVREHAAPQPPAERPPAQKPAEPSGRDQRPSEPTREHAAPPPAERAPAQRPAEPRSEPPRAERREPERRQPERNQPERKNSDRDNDRH